MEGSFGILIFLTGTVLALSYPDQHSPHSIRRLLNDVTNVAADMSSSSIEPPRAMKVKHEIVMFGDVRNDSYYWLRGDPHSNPSVLAYLQEENNYTDFVMSDTKLVEDQIYADIIGRIKEDGISVPRRRGSYYYYERTLAGKDYLQYCRRLALNDEKEPSVYDVMPTGPNSPPEHVMLDVNVRAQGNKNYRIGDFIVSPNHKLVAFTEDTHGDGNYTAHIIDAESTKPVERSLTGLEYSVVWAGNGSLLYTTMDATHRQERVWLHKLGEEQSDDLCLYHEKDESFFLYLQASESNEFVFIVSWSFNTSFTFYFDIANPQYGTLPLTLRIDGIETSVSHRSDHFFIMRTSDELYNAELLACPVHNVSAIVTILPHRESVTITGFQMFSNHLVVFERQNGLKKIVIFDLPSNGEKIQMLQIGRALDFMEPTYTLSESDSEFSSNILRFTYSTLKTPQTVFDYDLYTGISVVKNTETVLGGFDSSNYHTDRIWATSPDGVQVPMSIVYRKDLVKLDGKSPLLLYGHGAYGNSNDDPTFRSSILSLLDRGFIYVIAHVRGGYEMGKQWYENGKLLNKKNTFFDFIACAQYLIEMRYTNNKKLVIDGFGSGGLLIGAVINMRPYLFKAAITQSPFLDVLTTLLNTTLFNKEQELEEWGDPHKQEFYNYIKSYSPLDNVSAQRYPSLLVTTSLSDYRPYSDSAKFVAKLRDLKIDENLLLLKCDLSVEPYAIRRTADYKNEAFGYTFILKALNMIS